MLQSSKLGFSSNQKKFIAEFVGTFVLVVCATGSIVLDAKLGGSLGLSFIAFAPGVGAAVMIYKFAKISLSNFNPAVTVGFLITKHIPVRLFPLYFTAEISGALLGTVFVKYVIGAEANLGTNFPNYSYPIPLIFGVEVLATVFLMGMILLVMHTNGLRGFGWIAIGSVIGLDIFFLSFISGASMNPARSLAPALFSGAIGDLWLYCSATFVGSAIIAVIYRKIKDRFLPKVQ